MIRIIVGGLAANEICDLVAKIGKDQVDVRVAADIAGAKEVAQGNADYYFGACATGGGGALSMAIAILGYSQCFIASSAGKPPKAAEIEKAVKSGKKAFGFTIDHIDSTVACLMRAILAHNSLAI